MDNSEFKIKEVNIGPVAEEKKTEPTEPKPEIFLPKSEPMLQKTEKRSLISLFSRKNLIKILAVIIVLGLAAAAFTFLSGGGSFDPKKVILSIRVSNTISSGDEVLIEVDYDNTNRVDLKDARLVINYPAGSFSPDGTEVFQETKDVGNVIKKSQGSVQFKVRFVGDRGESKSITALMNYQPENISSRFESSFTTTAEINSVAIGLSVDGSEKAISGQEANYLITYENRTQEDISGLKLELAYDKDFKPKSEDPAPQEGTNNVWQIGTLKKGEKKSINVVGNLSGNEGESKSLKVVVGKTENNVFIKYSQLEYQTLISPSPLLLNLTLDGAGDDCKINPGQILRYIVEFKNNADVPLRELILKAYVNPDLLNVRNIQPADEGFFDSRENTITWNGGEVPALKLLDPGQTGKVSFSVPLKKPIPLNNYNSKSIALVASAEIGTKTVPAKFAVQELTITKNLSCKINTTVDLKTAGYYYEPTSTVANSGPVPPRVDAATTYTIHWQVVTGSNDLQNVSIRSVLPAGVTWMNNYVNNIPNSKVEYSERTGEIALTADKIPAGVGYIFPAYEFVFQVRITPSINQIGTTPTLINESFLEATDAFTGILLNDSTGPVTTTVMKDTRNPGGVVRE